jgi:hypothetical protein
VGTEHDEAVLTTRDRPDDVAERRLGEDVIDAGGPQLAGEVSRERHGCSRSRRARAERDLGADVGEGAIAVEAIA